MIRKIIIIINNNTSIKNIIDEKNDALKLRRTIEIERGIAMWKWEEDIGDGWIERVGKKRIFASWKDELVPGARFNNLHFSVSNWAKTMGLADRRGWEKIL